MIGYRDLGEGFGNINDLIGVRRSSCVVHVCLICATILLALHCPGEALMIQVSNNLCGVIPVFRGLALVATTEARRVGGLPLLGGGSHLKVETVLIKVSIHLSSAARVISSIIIIGYQSWLLEIIAALPMWLGDSAVIDWVTMLLLHCWHGVEMYGVRIEGGIRIGICTGPVCDCVEI